ncbi:hypothetical protein NMY22_g19545 [Coprinellus aureogranulatus]|nr:hypothetical protein NMY22_g19545 [Coprinellus aureogranulatus]
MYREALGIDTEGYPFRYNAFWGIGRSLYARFQHGKNIEDLHEAITSIEQALACIPDGDSDREELQQSASTYAEALAAWSAEEAERE